MKRTGTIYSEMTNKGRRSVKYMRGSKPVYCFNWVAEITVWGKRYRTRSKHRAPASYCCAAVLLWQRANGSMKYPYHRAGGR